MRIFFLGDPQYSPEDYPALRRIGLDIASASPDLTIVLGDYGIGADNGTGRGFEDALGRIGPFPEATIFMLGNHDVQGEAGERYVPSGTVRESYRKAFGCYPENRFLEFPDFRVFVINLDIQPVCHYSTRGECYVSEEHFHEIELKLSERPGVPVVMVTHAPPIGTGLVTVPDRHIRANNAYMDQFNEPGKWMRLYQRHREIVLWLCGHYHLGHEVPGTLVKEGHTVFALCGAATSESRTASRHSRVLDITSGEVRLSTFDHISHSMKDQPDLIHKGPLSSIMEEDWPAGNTFLSGLGRLKALASGGGKLYALTEGNYVWEIDPGLRATMGTLSNASSPTVLAIKAEEEYIWLYTEGWRYGVRYSSPRRFKNKFNTPDAAKEPFQGPLPESGGRIAVIDGRRYEVSDGDDDRLHLRRL